MLGVVAVEDAKLSNQAALLGYPRAVPTLKDSVQVVVPDITAEVIEEQTGKAPNMTNFKPDISLGGPDGYLRYLQIQALEESKASLIYVPTEAGLPVTEATRVSPPVAGQ